MLDQTLKTRPSIFGNTGGTHYSTVADGTVGSSVHIGAYYLQRPLGFANGKLIVAHSNYSGGYIDSMIKAYDTTDSYKVYHVLGKAGASTAVPCAADGSFTSTTCNVAIPVQVDTQTRYYFDSTYVVNAANGRWISATPDVSEVFYVPFGGSAPNVNSLTTTTEPIKAFAYYNNAGTEYIYYCGGTSNRLRRKIVGGADALLDWPVPNMTCEKRTLVFDPSGNAGAGSLIFIFKQNNLFGVAEHLDLIP
jgi:hypothetical protein